MQRLIFTILLFLPSISMAAESVEKQPQWWEVIGGILAIPVALLSLAYSYVLIRKTRLEARKTELEIVEKETALQRLAKTQPETAREVIQPIVEGRQGVYLVLRFVLLYVTLELWGLVSQAITFLIGGTFFGVAQLVKKDFDENLFIVVPFFILQSLPKIVTWIIVIGLGWPLFRDLNQYLNVNLKTILVPWKKS